MSQLQQLIGKKLMGLTHEVSYTVPLNSPSKGKEDFDLYLQILFDDYTLNIYNRHQLENANSLGEFENQILSKVDESDTEIVFHFGVRSLRVDMSDQGYTGTEALLLRGPNNLNVVWN
jgi:hypothetical protein